MPSTESHPFDPFLPENAKVLFLGSFPPQPKRWSMDFYYPNWINDFWRVCGLVFFGDKTRFEMPEQKKFDKSAIISFCSDKGFAMYDTATEIRRLQDNASDKYLEVVTPTDIPSLLGRIPLCRTIVTTGQKATDTLVSAYGCEEPPLGGKAVVKIDGKEYNLWRMPSTSRAYPLSIGKKASAYEKMFRETGLL